ncbi:unnamed protein product [Brassica oleracea var. botrytis]
MLRFDIGQNETVTDQLSWRHFRVSGASIDEIMSSKHTSLGQV